MSLSDRIFKRETHVSFEFFPPKSEAQDEALFKTADELGKLSPSYFSVTYGAGGSTQSRTLGIVKTIQERLGISCAAHLTCVGASRDQINETAKQFWDSGIKHIVALRGDGFEAREDGYAYASDLVAGLKKIADFEISVAGYPEKHPECPCPDKDVENLKRKVDAGADRVITQFFMEPECFLKWRDKAVKAGVTVPIEPGMLPIHHFGRAVNFAKRCEAGIPQWMHDLFEGLDDMPDRRNQVAVALCAEQCRILQDEGVDHFHFYTLNRSDLTGSVCRLLGR